MTRNLNGVITVDSQLCTGCGLCQKLCKFDAVIMVEGKAQVCDLCQGEPQCVLRCPTSALEYVESQEFNESVVEAFERMKWEWGLFE
jgi:Fe-S-cluster-containing hydrogenase component 2